MSKKLFMQAGLALCGALLMVASASAAPIKLQLWHGMGGELGTKTDEIIGKFNASQSEYELSGVYKGTYDQVMTAAITAFRAKQPPAMVQVYEVGTASMMHSRAIRPVHEIMAQAGSPVDNSKFLSAVLSYYVSADNKLQAMPFNSSTTVLYYNKDAMKKAGWDPEKFPATWPEVAKLAKDMKEKGGLKHGITSGWQSWVHLENLSALHNVPYATRANGYEGLDTELVFNGPLQTKHLEFLSGMMQDGTMVYVGRKSEAIPTFVAGDAGILTNSSGSYAAVKAGAKFDWGVAILPYWPEVKGAPQNTIIGGGAIWVMSGLSKEEEKGVAAFLNFLLQPEIQADFHQTTGYVPVTMAGYELTKSQGFYEKNPGTDIAIKSLTLNPPTPNSRGLRLGNYSQIRDIIDEEFEALWTKKKDAKKALDDMVSRGNQLLRRFERTAKQ